jgi:hypothetical protein
MGNMMSEDTKALRDFLVTYSLDDLAKAFFALNLWLPNISSPIKLQYLYVTLESIHRDLATESKLSTYAEFEYFYRELFQLLPSFVMLEDYVPEADWGEIKYYFDNRFYRIFYGGDLSNPYDFYYAFEMIHRTFNEQYAELLHRSPVQEMRFCLEAQNHILENLIQEKTEAMNEVSPGELFIPSEDFLKSVTEFLDGFRPDDIYREDILRLYTKDLAEPAAQPSMDTFIENAYRGRNSRYMFIKEGGRYYPVMPRKWLTVMYDNWGLILRDRYEEIVNKLGKRDPAVLIGIELAKFIGERINKDDVFPLATPVQADYNPPHDLLFTAVRTKNSVVLVYVTPPVFDPKALSRHLEEIRPKLKESGDLVGEPPTRLGLRAEHQIVEFRSDKGDKALKPIFLIALPSALTEIEGMIAIPEGIEAEIMTLDQVAGIFDEIENAAELSDFIDYLETERQFNRMTGLNSYLDNFGSFKDSHGVLVAGALEPNMIMLDVNWGSQHRYRNLRDFWEVFPQDNFFNHPRSWTIPTEQRTATGFILNSKSFFGYAYYQRVGDSSFYINAPVHLMSYQEGMILDSTMQSLFDAIDLYQSTLDKLDFIKRHIQFQVIFFPASVVERNDELQDMGHLLPEENLWAMDCTRLTWLGRNKVGIRVVYNDESMPKALEHTQDRSVQISMLIDVLKQLSQLFLEPNLDNVIAELEKEKTKPARFGAFAVTKSVSFPEGVGKVIPEEKEYKLADKEIAKIAHGLGIEPGEYSAEEAQEKLNTLRSQIVESLNAKVAAYNLTEALPLLIEKANVLIHDSWYAEEQIKASLDHEVDYERGVSSSEGEKDFRHWYRTYRYLIEKFVQLEPSGNVDLEHSRLKEFLAFIDRLLNIYSFSDFINYEIIPVRVQIDRDYIVSTSDEKNDVAKMEREYGEEQAKIKLGIIGNQNDTADASLSITDYLDELDSAFYQDFGFGLKNLASVQRVLSQWATRAGKEEHTYYHATAEEIASVCAREIQDYDPAKTEPILEFLTLKPKELLAIKDDPKPAHDLPVWEHNKRLMRYDIRPLIKIGDEYFWGPHTIDRVAHIWLGITTKHKLPSDINAPTVKAVLQKGHVDLENSLINKIKEVVLRHTNDLKTDVYPHKRDKSISNIGDYDVLAYLKGKNTLLNIESKIIDPPYSNKDSGRMQRMIFGETRADGTFKKGYLQKVEERGSYLKAKGKDLMAKLGWGIPTIDPTVVSIFVTKIGFWWTKHPPVTTEVNFVEIRMLDDFIKNL